VVLPDHLHCLWTLPPGDADFPVRWRKIKALFSRQVAYPEGRPPSLVRKREAGVWQRRYWEHTIRDDADCAAQMDYIPFNPVKHGLAEPTAAWPFSTFLTRLAQGVYPEGWALADSGVPVAGERSRWGMMG
jgi:putative transposase